MSAVQATTSNMSARSSLEVADLLSLDGRAELCRAVSLATISRSCASLWADSKGSAETYALSRPVKSIDSFLSHNWAVGRWRKWLLLCFHFNFKIAAASSFFVTALLTALTMLQIIPHLHEPDGDIKGMWGRVVAAPVFFLVLLFRYDFAALLGLPTRNVFLDKVCINQEDPLVQREGILKLGAFLGRSDEMVIMYTNIYLRKLWTVYEVAAFLLQHQTASKSLKVVPVQLVFMYLIMLIWGALQGTAGSFSNSVGTGNTGVGVVAFLGGNSYMLALRSWQHDRLAMQDALRKFTVRDSLCAIESDRPMVYANIATLVRAFRMPEGSATLNEEEALDVFDETVRRELPPAFSSAFGLLSFDHYHYLYVGFLMLGATGMDYLAVVPISERPRYNLAGAALWFHWAFAFWPATFFVMEYIASSNRHWAGWKEVLWVFFACAATGPLVFAYYLLCWNSLDWAAKSDVVLASILVMSLLTVAMGLVGCTSPARAPHKRVREVRESSFSHFNTEDQDSWSQETPAKSQQGVERLHLEAGLDGTTEGAHDYDVEACASIDEETIQNCDSQSSTSYN